MENTVIKIENTQNLFTKLLCEALCDENNDKCEKCLITGDNLENSCIKMTCNHSFNYEAIMKEIKAQKVAKKYNHLETQKLTKSEIKCPYCRTIQKGLLPFRKGFPKIRYVNWPPALTIKANMCSAILKSGKRKGDKCGKACYEKFCGSHLYYMNQDNKKTEVVNYPICEAIIKSGKRKGDKCGCKLKPQFIQNKRCGKHLKINK